MLPEKECLLWVGGYGYGDGNSYGNGDSYGDGNGDGYGGGYGNGNGDSNGYGNGGGYGDGDGDGDGNGDGYGNGYGDGDGDGDGEGNDCYYYMPHPYYKVDGIWCKLLSIRGDYAHVKIADLYHTENCVLGFIAKDNDGNFAHGATLREAHESLMYKIGMRDISVYESWKLTDIKTKAELIKAYPVITGACEFGTKQFCSTKKLPDKATVAQAIELTAGQYGAGAFKNFFENKG